MVSFFNISRSFDAFRIILFKHLFKLNFFPFFLSSWLDFRTGGGQKGEIFPVELDPRPKIHSRGLFQAIFVFLFFIWALIYFRCAVAGN